MTFMEQGVINHIHDDGRVLTVGLPADWLRRGLDNRRATLHVLACYAEAHHRLIRYYPLSY
jgi:hypothetical protein